MEFQYYYDQTKLDQSLILELQEYPSLIGDFTSNSNPNTAVGNTIPSVTSDITVFFTYSKPSNRNAFLFCKRKSDFTGGWVLGIDDNNHLFIEGFGTSSSESYRFNITLGKKNCLAFKQIGNYFTVYRYDIFGKNILETDTFLFPPDINLQSSNNNLYLAWDSSIGNTYYNKNKTVDSSINVFYPFNGVVDQYVVIGASLDDYYINYLFQGFCPETINIQTALKGVLLSSEQRLPSETKMTSNFVNMFMSGASGFNDYLLNQGISGGVYISMFSGIIGYGLNPSLPSLPGGIVSYIKHTVRDGYDCKFCFDAGPIVYNPPQFNLTSPLATGTVGSFNFNGTATIARDSDSKLYLTHNISVPTGTILGSGKTLLTLDYIYQLETVQTGFSKTIDSGYYSGFYMEGIVVPGAYQSIILGTITGETFNNLNLVGRYNLTTGQFRVEDSGRMYFNGQLLNPSDYSVIKNYINIIPFTENSDDYLIYDKTNKYMDLLSLSLTSSATGKYWPECSIGFTGVNSYGPFKRIFKEDWLETVSYHTYHDIDTIQLNTKILDNFSL